MAAPCPGGPRADGESLLRSRKRNFSEAEVSALLRCVSARRKKLLAAPQDKVPLWQRTQIWKQVTEAVNTASGFRNRRTPGEVKKKWSDIKIEAKKRLRLATERGDDGELRPTDKRILAILQQDQDQDCPINLDPDPDPDPDQDCPISEVKQEPDSGLDSGLGLPTIVHVTTVKSEPLLSESDPSSTSTSASAEHTQIKSFSERNHHDNHATEHAQINSFSERNHHDNHATERAQINPFSERNHHDNHATEHAHNTSFTERAQINNFTEHAQMNHTVEHAQMNHVTEHAQMNHTTEHAQSARPDPMLLLLQNQQLILDTLRDMAQTFSQINSSLKDISHSLKNR